LPAKDNLEASEDKAGRAKKNSENGVTTRLPAGTICSNSDVVHGGHAEYIYCRRILGSTIYGIVYRREHREVKDVRANRRGKNFGVKKEYGRSITRDSKLKVDDSMKRKQESCVDSK
jgi:hypothetical protein